MHKLPAEVVAGSYEIPVTVGSNNVAALDLIGVDTALIRA
jgi:hypothetical protein